MTTSVDAAAPMATIRLSGLHAGREMLAMREYLASVMRVDLAPLDATQPLRYEASLRTVPGASWGGARVSPVRTTRTAALCKDGQDDLMLLMPQAETLIEQPGREALRVRPGGAVLVSQARPMQISQQAGAAWMLRVPHRDAARMLPRLSDAPMIALHEDTPMLGLLQRYGKLLESEALRGAATQQLAARQLQDMLAVALGQSPDYAAWAEQNSLASARLQALRADMAAHLTSSRLCLEWLAARQGLSPRHLQRMLAAEGTSYLDTLRQVRVQAAYAMLKDPKNAAMSITAIAYACGFSDAPGLNRAFRQHYGMTPGEARWHAR
ncbi:helix-turn-helix transcriptional regulator [Ottowia thiooxydans]|uniref:helix-turn-helix transcriptional regulator n=1 Tax=Ottowia thiooxydans TaxID=219182 RepID=UPI000418D8E8|nr:AraC family transcriptional regulator [Ottowia thiooxydans]